MIKYAWRIGIPVSSQSCVGPGLKFAENVFHADFIKLAFFLKIDLFRQWILQIELFPLSQRERRERDKEKQRETERERQRETEREG